MKSLADDPLELALEFVQHTGANIFLTGKAGTGKTTFLHNLRHHTDKRMIVTAPTGVAAINAGGVTLHSFFQLPFGPQVLEEKPTDSTVGFEQKAINKFSRDKVNIIRSMDLLVIDEISMVRADLLDAVDKVLRRFRNRYQPFGGIQLLMIGDLCQLAPVVKESDWELLKAVYDSPFFFDSKALKKAGFVSIELQHVYRQSDERFIGLLNKVRDNQLDRESMEILNSRCFPDLDAKGHDGYITLTTHNNQAFQLNNDQMARIDHPGTRFESVVMGDFPTYAYPNESTLLLKPGAQVMFVKNDASKEKRYYNGKIGTVSDIEDGLVSVVCPGDTTPIITGPVEWHNYSYTLDKDTDEIVEQLLGTFIQIPVRPAWAITIHKSQGLTFDKAIIDAGAAFAHGQVYVALSRCRSLEGMILKSRIGQSCLRSNAHVRTFMTDASFNRPNADLLEKMKQAFDFQLLLELNDFSVIKRQVDVLEKLLIEHEKSLVGFQLSHFLQAKKRFVDDILAVSKTFNLHIRQMFDSDPQLDTNMALQERMGKASSYYFGMMNEINDLFVESLSFETDNRAIKKSLSESVDRLEREFAKKLICLDATKCGFSSSNYLLARSRSSIEKPYESGKPATTGQSDGSYSETTNLSLYNALKAWRDETAKRLNVRTYQVIPTRALAEISDTSPNNLTQLKRVKGIGDKKIKQFGRDILRIILNRS